MKGEIGKDKVLAGYNARWDKRGKPIKRRIQYENRTRCEKVE